MVEVYAQVVPCTVWGQRSGRTSYCPDPVQGSHYILCYHSRVETLMRQRTLYWPYWGCASRKPYQNMFSESCDKALGRLCDPYL